jgi:hypothetical protein
MIVMNANQVRAVEKLAMRHSDVITEHPEKKIDAAPPALINFSSIKRDNNIVWPLISGDVSIQTGLFRDLFRIALECVPVDERYYLRTYPDVREAMEDGLFTSPRHHFIEFGYFEDRLPFRIEVDEDYYFRSNPDIKESVNSGFIPSAQVHFERYGYKEGRLPREGWSLLAN